MSPFLYLYVMKEIIRSVLKQYTLRLTESIVGDRIVCDDCGWAWKIEEGGDDLYMCHQCGHDNTPQNINESKKSPYFRYWDKYGPEIDDDFLWAFGIDSGVPVEVYRELIKYYGGFLKYKKSVDEYIKDKVFEVEPGNRYGGYDFKYKLKLVGEDYSPNSDYDVDNNWTPFTPEYTEIQILPGGTVDLINHGGEMDLEEAVNDQEFGWEIKHEINDVVNEQQSKEGIFSKFGVYPFDKRIKFI